MKSPSLKNSISNSCINPKKTEMQSNLQKLLSSLIGINAKRKFKFPKRVWKPLEVLHINTTVIFVSPVEIYKLLWVHTWIPRIEDIKVFCHVHAHHCQKNSVLTSYSLPAEQRCKLCVTLLRVSRFIVSTLLLALRNRILHCMSTLSWFWYIGWSLSSYCTNLSSM